MAANLEFYFMFTAVYLLTKIPVYPEDISSSVFIFSSWVITLHLQSCFRICSAFRKDNFAPLVDDGGSGSSSPA